MSQLSAELRRKPEWWKHHRDEEHRKLWQAEAADRTWEVKAPSSIFKIQLTQKQIDYVLDELDGYAALRDEANQCQVSCFERIWESDILFDAEYATALLRDLAKLRGGSQQHIADGNGVETSIIDPLLHCLVYHRTLVRWIYSQTPQPLPPPVSNDSFTVSLDFSALPSDVSLSKELPYSAQFKSYINNVHPDQHKSLYTHLEALLSKSVPLFEHTLTDLHRNNPLTERIHGACRYTVWDEPDAPESSDDEEGWVRYEREMREWVMNRPIQLPEVHEDGYPGGMEKRRHVVSLKGKQVQVLTRATEIHLIPGGPEFSGTDWHVEGMRSERIVACNYHFIQCDNVSPSSLEFRAAVSYPRGFLAGDTGATLRTWGITDGDACHQYIGSLPIRQNLSVTYPNIYQSRHTPFRLLDPDKPGRMTILTFLLVDPDIRPIISTSKVPPQQEAWIKQAVYDALTPRLPSELVEEVVARLEGFMTPEEAEHYRGQFAETLERFTQASNSTHFCIPFDVWNGPDSVR
ncbi:hypothetical protein H1R20_g1033, partial [Candolleomyces eurysporus]